MPNAPPLADPQPIDLDLLVVGGLTVDRFADGQSLPGGSVMHAVRALRATSARVGVVTLAGDEPAARDGLRELGETAAAVHVEPAERSIGFLHAEVPTGRRLTFERSAGLLACPARAVRPATVLFAPVADELGPSLGGQAYEGARRGAILQGWLRELRPGRVVRQLPLSALPEQLISTLATLDLLVASHEDLAAVGPTPSAQLEALRASIGTGPVLVVTNGAAGAWVDHSPAAAGGAERWHVATGRTVANVNTVGAGDVLAAALLLAWPTTVTRPTLTNAIQRAMAVVESVLAGRAALTSQPA
jgi:sugar/nucleoside kinase (ribokinase family)